MSDNTRFQNQFNPNNLPDTSNRNKGLEQNNFQYKPQPNFKKEINNIYSQPQKKSDNNRDPYSKPLDNYFHNNNHKNNPKNNDHYNNSNNSHQNNYSPFGDYNSLPSASNQHNNYSNGGFFDSFNNYNQENNYPSNQYQSDWQFDSFSNPNGNFFSGSNVGRVGYSDNNFFGQSICKGANTSFNNLGGMSYY